MSNNLLNSMTRAASNAASQYAAHQVRTAINNGAKPRQIVGAFLCVIGIFIFLLSLVVSMNPRDASGAVIGLFWSFVFLAVGFPLGYIGSPRHLASKARRAADRASKTPLARPSQPVDFPEVFLSQVAAWARANPHDFILNYIDHAVANNPAWTNLPHDAYDRAYRHVQTHLEGALKEYLDALRWMSQHDQARWNWQLANHPR